MKKGVAENKPLTQLEEVLQVIRKSPKEPQLKEQGFTPEYYLVFDLARELNTVAEYLRVINVDSEKTHVQYFSDQIEKTLGKDTFAKFL